MVEANRPTPNLRTLALGVGACCAVLAAHPSWASHCTPATGCNGCSDLRSQNISVSYDSSQGKYDYSFEICNNDSCVMDTVVQDFDVQLRLIQGSHVPCPQVNVTETVSASVADPFTAGECEPFSDSVVADESCTDGLCTWELEIDPNETVREGHEEDSTETGVVSNHLPDFDIADSVSCEKKNCDDHTCIFTVDFTVESNSKCTDAVISGRELGWRITGNGCDAVENQINLTDPRLDLTNPIELHASQDSSFQEQVDKDCKCCFLHIDANGETTESDEANNKDNFNITQAQLRVGFPVQLRSPLANMEDFPVSVSHQLLSLVPPGWSVDVGSSPTIPANSDTPLTLTYTAPPGAVPTTFEVRTTEQETGFVQRNTFVLLEQVPAVSVRGLLWATIAIFAAAAAPAARRWQQRRRRAAREM